MARRPVNHSFYGQGPLAPLGGRSQQGQYSPSMQMGQQLMRDGASMAPVQSPLEGISRALRGGLGGYMNYATMKAMGDEQKLTDEQRNAILQAMTPSEAVKTQDARPETLIPGGNPHTMGASEIYNAFDGTRDQAKQYVQQSRWDKANTPLGADGYAGAISPAREEIAAQPEQTAMQNALTAYAGIQDPTAATTAMGQQLLMARAGQEYQASQLAEERAYKAGLLSEKRAFDIANPGLSGSGASTTAIRNAQDILGKMDALDDAIKSGDESAIAIARRNLEVIQNTVARDPDTLYSQSFSDKSGALDAQTEAAPDLQSNTVYGREIAESNMALYETATGAVDTISKADELIVHLNSSGAVTGMGAEMVTNINRLKALMGDQVAAGKVSDTEILDAMMGSEVFGMIKALGVGARGLDTPAEREFMRAVLTGTISLNKATLVKMAQLRKSLAQRSIDRWNTKTGNGELDGFYDATGISRTPLGQMVQPMAGAAATAPAVMPPASAAIATPASAVNAAPVVITNDDEYNALKSGTKFIDPNGDPRTKP